LRADKHAHIHNQIRFVNIFIRQISTGGARLAAQTKQSISFLDLAALTDQKSPSSARTNMTDISTILLDRDGTLIEERHYLRDPDLVALIPGVAVPMRRLGEMGCGFYLASNQSGIGRGLFSAEEYRRVHARLEELLLAEDIRLSGAAHCPHAPEDGCQCRKPRTGLWLELTGRFNLSAHKAVMIGDKVADIRFGQAIGCAETVLVLTGHGPEAARRLGLAEPLAPVLRCPPGPDRPTWLARDLGSYLSQLVQKKEHVHAHRV